MPQEPILFDEVRDRLALPAVEPANEHAQHDLQCGWVDHEAELKSQLREETSIALWHSTGFLAGTGSVC
jgi:hypothetical protein